MWIKNAWYQVGWSEDVTIESPSARTILNVPLLIFRKKDGGIAALHDRCPHRFVPLSAGKVVDDVVTCAYHGLAFSADGSCAKNPHSPIVPALCVQSYKVIEKHAAIWIWMGDENDADLSLLPDMSFIDQTPVTAQIKLYMPTQCNYRLATDNIMDLSHADFLHSTSIGGIMSDAQVTINAGERDVTVEWLATDCLPPPAFKPLVAPAERADIWVRVVWRAPALMILSTAATPTGIERQEQDITNTLHNMVPETETSTHYFVCSTRKDHLDDPEFHKMLSGALTHAFQEEDKPILEQQQARMGTPDLMSLKPVLLPIDRAAMSVRRALDGMIEREADSAS